MSRHPLPPEVKALVHARNKLRDRYPGSGLAFTLDGNLVGDLGEAVAAGLFGLTLAERRGEKAVDAFAPGKSSVQIKTTGRGRSVAFTHADDQASRLLVLVLDYEKEEVEIVYNGPYGPAVSRLSAPWVGQKLVPVSLLRQLDAVVSPDERLPLVLQP